jgi:uncharacterized protein (UPF0335 family)
MSSEKEYIAKLVKLYTEEESILEQVKDIKDEAKEAGFDHVILSAVAKAIVKNKVDELAEKSESILSAIELARS